MSQTASHVRPPGAGAAAASVEVPAVVLTGFDLTLADVERVAGVSPTVPSWWPEHGYLPVATPWRHCARAGAPAPPAGAGCGVAVSDGALRRVAEVEAAVKTLLHRELVYGLNVRFGQEAAAATDPYSGPATHTPPAGVKPADGDTTTEHTTMTDPDELAAWNRNIVAQHATRIAPSHGPPDAHEPLLAAGVVRAALMVIVNGWCRGHAPVRRVLLHKLLAVANGPERLLPRVESGGSMGASDLIPVSQLTFGCLDPAVTLAAGEGIALVSNNAVSVVRGALAAGRAQRGLDAAVVAVGLSMEAARANLSTTTRHAESLATCHDATAAVMQQLRHLTAGSALHHGRSAAAGPLRVQDFLSMRDVACVLGNAVSALNALLAALQAAVNHCHTNPIIIPHHDAPRADSVPAYNVSHLCSTVDSVRQALALVAVATASRAEKLVDERFNKLHPPFSRPMLMLYRRNLTYWLHYYGRSAMLLAGAVTPFSCSTHISEGCEDLLTPLPHSVALLERQVVAVERVVALEALIAASVLHTRLSTADAAPTRVFVQRKDVAPAVLAVYDAMVDVLPVTCPVQDVYCLQPLLCRFLWHAHADADAAATTGAIAPPSRL